LDQTLNSLNVQRQAYHGKSFFGNHVHKMLKVYNSIITVTLGKKYKHTRFSKYD